MRSHWTDKIRLCFLPHLTPAIYLLPWCLPNWPVLWRSHKKAYPICGPARRGSPFTEDAPTLRASPSWSSPATSSEESVSVNCNTSSFLTCPTHRSRYYINVTSPWQHTGLQLLLSVLQDEGIDALELRRFSKQRLYCRAETCWSRWQMAVRMKWGPHKVRKLCAPKGKRETGMAFAAWQERAFLSVGSLQSMRACDGGHADLQEGQGASE